MSALPDRPLRLDDLLGMSQAGLRQIIDRAHPLDPAALIGQQYHGVDLSMPALFHKLAWRTFRKCFIDDGAGGVRGWNVRMEQRGDTGPQAPLRGADGQPRTFAHYRLRARGGLRFPRGWAGAHYLDYAVPENPFGEALAKTPLVAVNAGSSDLLLGWEVFRLGPLWVPLADFWVLQREGPVDFVPPAARALAG
jgi:hypothetical protein